MVNREINKSIIQEFNVWESSTREEFLTPSLSDTWWHFMLNVLWCLLTSAPTLGSDWSLGGTWDGKKFPGSVVPQRYFASFLKNSARERHNRKHCTNQEVSLFQTSYSSGAMSSSRFSGLSLLLIISTWQNGNGKCACSWLSEECRLVMVRDLSQMSTEITLGTFSAGVNTPAPSQLFKYIPATKNEVHDDWLEKKMQRQESIANSKSNGRILPTVCQHIGNMDTG